MSKVCIDTACLALRRLQGVRRPALVALIAVCCLFATGRTAQSQEALRALEGLVSLEGLDTPTDDLIRLATENADALFELKKSRLAMETALALRPNAVVTNLEVQIARLGVEAADRKVRIIRAITEKRLAAATNKLEIITHLESLPLGGAGAGGDFNPRTYVRIQDEATIEILRMILAMD